eukprot:COSAG01_NODE_1637_length_9660_cov_7.731932_6_plen_211_part_00
MFLLCTWRPTHWSGPTLWEVLGNPADDCWRLPTATLPATTLLATAHDNPAGSCRRRPRWQSIIGLSGMGCLAVWRSGGLAVWLCSACALACQSVSRTLDTPVTAWFYQGGGARWRVPGEIPPPVAPAVSFRVVVQSGRYSGRLCFLPVHHVSVRWRVSVCLWNALHLLHLLLAHHLPPTIAHTHHGLAVGNASAHVLRPLRQRLLLLLFS